MAFQAFQRTSALVTVCAFLLCLGVSPVITLPPMASRLPGPSRGPGLLQEAEKEPLTMPYLTGEPHQQRQVTNMIETLSRAGQFDVMVALLQDMDMTSLTPHTTWFLPTDVGFENLTNFGYQTMTSFLNYHVIRTLLPYTKLSTLRVGTRLQTFSRKVCMVTANSPRALTIDDAKVVFRDLYWDGSVAVHGIDSFMDSNAYNETWVDSSESNAAPKSGLYLPILAAASLFIGVALLW